MYLYKLYNLEIHNEINVLLTEWIFDYKIVWNNHKMLCILVYIQSSHDKNNNQNEWFIESEYKSLEEEMKPNGIVLYDQWNDIVMYNVCQTDYWKGDIWYYTESNERKSI